MLLVSTAASTLIGIGTAAVQARLLGPAGRGELAQAVVPATIIAMLACFGMPDFLAREAARHGDSRALSKATLIASLLIGAALLCPYVFLAQFQASMWSDAWWLLVVYAFSLPLFVYGYCLSGLAIGSGRWAIVAVIRVVPGLASLVVLVGLAVTKSVASPLIVGLVMLSFAALLPLAYAFQSFARPRGRLPMTTVRKGVAFGLRGWPAGALALINQRIDLLLVTAMATHSEVGYYAVATTLAAILNAIANAIALPARNRVARGDVSVISKMCAFTMTVICLIGVGLIAVLPVLVEVLLGATFLPAMPVMVILIVAQVPLGGVVVLTQSLVGASLPGAPLGGEVAALVSTTVLTFFMFSHLGILAAAIATGIGNVISLLVLIRLVRKHVANDRIWHFMLVSPTRAIRIARGS